MNCTKARFLVALAGLALLMAIDRPGSAATREQIEADWLRQAEVWHAAKKPEAGNRAAAATTTAADAAGAVDGVKNGKYGFHTAKQTDPWWQVDLGQPVVIERIVVFNRLDYAAGLHNADRMVVLTSDDGAQWTKRHDCAGRHFGGISGEKPLTVEFKETPVKARFVRLQVPSEKPLYFHLDEVEVYGAGDPKTNVALKRRADQSSLSEWSTAKVAATATPAAPTPSAYPTADILARARRLAAELRRQGVDTAAQEKELDEAQAQLKTLPVEASPDVQKALYFRARWAMRRLALSNPLLNFDQLLLCKRFTQETYPDVCLNHMPWVSRPGGDVAVLTGWKGEGEAQVRTLIQGALGPGHVHGMDLWWDGTRVVFGYAKAKSDMPVRGFPGRLGHRTRLSEEPTHIFGIGIDGQGLKQLTDDKLWSDLDPTYLPNGDIAFVSDRCSRSLECNQMPHDETSCNLYVMRPDGSNIRRLSVTKDGDYLPHALDDGTIAYTRWEYQERGLANIHSIWFVRPDGTGADALFRQHFNNPWALEDTRPIPNSKKLVAIACGHHTLAAGPMVVIDHHRGINEPTGINIVTPGVLPSEGGMSGIPVAEGGVAVHGGFYMHPWALSETTFLASYCYGRQTDPTGYAIYLIDVFGTMELLHRDPDISCFTPIPLRPRPRPPILPDLTDPTQKYAVCTLANVAQGVPGVDPKSIRYLRISEPVAWPYDREFGGQRYEPDASKVNWTPVRVLGTVPVEPDGSAYFRVPADTAVYFQILDENQMELRRMRSFISFQPGEQRGCTGCHESRAAAPSNQTPASSTAMGREPSVPVPPPWGDRPISFLRDIQPIFDKHCVSCHSGLKPAAGLDFSSGLTATYNRAFDTILDRRLVSRSPFHGDANITMPLAFGSHKSKLVAALRKGEKPGEMPRWNDLTSEERLRLVTWIDANAPYNDGFINKRADPPPYDLAADRDLASSIAAVHAKRCASCHQGVDVSRLDWIDIRQPQQSLFLVAPLAKAAGGTGKCKGDVYKDRSDPDCVAVEALVRAAVKKAWALPRRDVRAVVPR
jgi:hypothetical protein